MVRFHVVSFRFLLIGDLVFEASPKAAASCWMEVLELLWTHDFIAMSIALQEDDLLKNK